MKKNPFYGRPEKDLTKALPPQKIDVLLSLQDVFVYLIFGGFKKGELRTTKPNIPCPFRVKVYCTKNPKYKLGKSRLQLYFSDEEREKPMLVYYHELEGVPVNGTVVGEFTVNEISEHTWSEAGYTPAINEHDVDLNREDIVAYGRGKTLYVWHISNPVLYRNPIPFNEADFRRPCISPEMPYCPSCRFGIEHISEGEQEALRAFGSCNTQWVCLNWLKKPPQSWCYISGEKHVAASELF